MKNKFNPIFRQYAFVMDNGDEKKKRKDNTQKMKLDGKKPF